MEILRLSETGFEKAAAKAAEVLKKGGIVLYPTDTLYGLGVDATNEKAILALKELKGREKKKPISIIVSSVEDIPIYAHMNEIAKSLAAHFFPGALTLVMPGTENISKELMLNDAIGVRIPADPFCAALAQTFGKPFTTTSANKSGRETPRTVQEVLQQFGNHAHDIALAIDAGPKDGAKPSTVVLCVSETAHILREGAILREVLQIP